VAEDHPVSLRGVYYRVVSAGAVEKTEAAYRLVGRQLLKLRRSCEVPYSHITDGTRWIVKPTSWSGVDEMLEDAAISYRRALWHEQPVEVHVFTEKDAISGVISPVTERWDVALGVLRGYASESFAHSVAEAIKDSSKKTIYIYQLGDHDPSGVDAWRSFRETVAGFLGDKVTAEMAARAAQYGVGDLMKVGASIGVSECDPDDDYAGDWAEQVTYMFLGGRAFHNADVRKVTFARLAVTEQQVEEWGLPTRPTKQTDTRARNFTGGSVEVDAIPASRLRQILEDAIVSHIDAEAWTRLREVEDLERESLESFIDSWRGIAS